MNVNGPAVWSIQSKGIIEAESLFINTSHIAVGWPRMGNLSLIEASRDAFRIKIAACYLEMHNRLIPIYASELFQFVHRIAIADVVAFPATFDRKIYLGQIEAPYRYDPGLSERYPNLYPVKWLSALPESRFTPRALREIDFPLVVNRIRDNAEEILTVLKAGMGYSSRARF